MQGSVLPRCVAALPTCLPPPATCARVARGESGPTSEPHHDFGSGFNRTLSHAARTECGRRPDGVVELPCAPCGVLGGASVAV